MKFIDATFDLKRSYFVGLDPTFLPFRDKPTKTLRWFVFKQLHGDGQKSTFKLQIA